MQILHYEIKTLDVICKYQYTHSTQIHIGKKTDNENTLYKSLFPKARNNGISCYYHTPA